MALKPVQDPALLQALESPAAAPQAGPKPVTDPALLAQLNEPSKPPSFGEQVPALPDGSAQVQEPDSLWERVKNAVAGDPIIDMWLSSLGTAAKGAPETAMNAVGNFGVNAAAGLSAPLLTSDADDQANFVRDFTAENSMYPQLDSTRQLTEGLGEAMEPLGNIKRWLGETVLGATDSPLAATAADMAPDLAMTMLGGPRATSAAPKTRLPGKLGDAPAGALAEAPAAKPPVRDMTAEGDFDLGEALAGGRQEAVEGPVSPIVGDLRAADIRMRPSDVQAMHPKAKVPGTFREKFSDGPGTKNDMTLHNQGRYTDLAAEELGVKTGVQGLDEAAFNEAAKGPAATYDMVENVLRDRDMSPQTVQTFRDALDSIKLELPRGEKVTLVGVLGKLRKRAAKRIQSDNPEMEAKGYADRNMAESLEDALENELNAAGEPQLFSDYQAARQSFAKIHDVESATRAGQVDANVLFKLGQKGAKLSGRLKLIADAAEHAPNVSQHSLKTASRTGEGVPESRSGAITRGAKALVRAIPGMDISKPDFQKTLGAVDETRTANYGRRSDVSELPDPSQGEMDLRQVLDLEAPPGAVGAPERSLRDIGPQVDALGNAFEFEAPPGAVGVLPDEQMTLQELLGLGEPLVLKKPPGRAGKKKG